MICIEVCIYTQLKELKWWAIFKKTEQNPGVVKFYISSDTLGVVLLYFPVFLRTQAYLNRNTWLSCWDYGRTGPKVKCASFNCDIANLDCIKDI